MKEYKLIYATSEEQMFGDKMEALINRIASDGWEYSFTVERNWIFFEREVLHPGSILPADQPKGSETENSEIP